MNASNASASACEQGLDPGPPGQVGGRVRKRDEPAAVGLAPCAPDGGDVERRAVLEGQVGWPHRERRRQAEERDRQAAAGDVTVGHESDALAPREGGAELAPRIARGPRSALPPLSRARSRSRWSSGSPMVSIGAVMGTRQRSPSTVEAPTIEPKWRGGEDDSALAAAKAASTGPGFSISRRRRRSRALAAGRERLRVGPHAVAEGRSHQALEGRGSAGRRAGPGAAAAVRRRASRRRGQGCRGRPRRAVWGRPVPELADRVAEPADHGRREVREDDRPAPPTRPARARCTVVPPHVALVRGCGGHLAAPCPAAAPRRDGPIRRDGGVAAPD